MGRYRREDVKRYVEVVDGIRVSSFNDDTESEWVVRTNILGTRRFHIKKYSLREAIQFCADLSRLHIMQDEAMAKRLTRECYEGERNGFCD